MQDCVCLIAPYPNNPNPPETFDVASDFDMSGSNLLWYRRLKLLFRCTRPLHLAPQSRSYRGRCAPSGGDSGLLQHL